MTKITYAFCVKAERSGCALLPSGISGRSVVAAGNTIVVEDSAGVRTITLNRPEKLNSFNEEMHGALRSALAGCAEDGVRAVLLTGAGKGFCAGQDLLDRVQGEDGKAPDLGYTIATLWNPLVRAIRSLAKPVVCAVNGVAAGAGANVALSCDIVLAARSARFIQSFCRLGLVPDSGGTYHLPRLVGEARAKGLALLGDALGAEQAESWGLIWKVINDDQLMSEARKLASHLATQPTYGLGLTKQAIHASATNSFDAQTDLERDLQREAGRTPDYAEGVRAFFEKRSPRFSGRKD
jgi:2-(1,2-epoxy-1,2-dihydrophenyl)acetyl-CoA isomerase